MAHLSIRKLPPEIENAIQQEAKKRNVTKTLVVLDILRESFHLNGASPKVNRDIRSFFGKMSRQDYSDFQKTTRDFSEIDKDLWK